MDATTTPLGGIDLEAQERINAARADARNAALDAADKVAQAVSELTELDPVGCKPRGAGFVVEGYRDDEVAVRIVLDAAGRLDGAWDPENVLHTLAEAGVL
jgi:hypothetical protein